MNHPDTQTMTDLLRQQRIQNWAYAVASGQVSAIHAAEAIDTIQRQVGTPAKGASGAPGTTIAREVAHG
jgi:hypothetical protein